MALGGVPVRFASPKAAALRGLTYLSEDRKGRGLHLRLPLAANLTLMDLDRHARPWLDARSERRALQQAVDDFGIRCGDLDAPAASLSGGNQQKLAIAKVLQPGPRVVVLDEPTRGVDVGARRDIYFLIRRLADEGRAVIVVSSEMVELGLVPIRSQAAEGRPRVPVRYSEVVRSMFFAPAYVAMSRGFFRDAGLEVTMSTANGGDKAMAALLGGGADIALLGPEMPIYVQHGESAVKARIFCGMTAADGYLLCARERMPAFDWAALRGQPVMGWRPASTPQVFLETALRLRGLDPQRDVSMITDIAPPARAAAWLAGKAPYAIFSEPEASQLELDGKAHVVASIGATVGRVDYTVFAATDDYLKSNAGAVQAWTDAVARAMAWTEAAPTAQLAEALAPFFPAASPQALADGIERYRGLQLWKTTPAVAPESLDRFQDILVQSKVLEPGRRVAYERIATAQFAERAR